MREKLFHPAADKELVRDVTEKRLLRFTVVGLKRTCVQKLSSILTLLTFMSVLPLALFTTSLRLLVHFPNLLCERGRGWQADLSNRGVRCGAEVTYAVRNGTGKIAEFPQEEATP